MSAAAIRTAAALAAVAPGTALVGRIDQAGDMLLIVWGKAGPSILAQWASTGLRELGFSPGEGPKPYGQPFLLVPAEEGGDDGLRCRITSGAMAGRTVTIGDPAGKYQARDENSNSVQIMADAASGRLQTLADFAPARSELLAVQQAARLVDGAQDTLRAAVTAAAEAGVPLAEIADVAGTSRQTVYRWLGRWERT